MEKEQGGQGEFWCKRGRDHKKGQINVKGKMPHERGGTAGGGGLEGELRVPFWRQVWTGAIVVKALVEERQEGGGCGVGL